MIILDVILITNFEINIISSVTNTRSGLLSSVNKLVEGLWFLNCDNGFSFSRKFPP